MLTSGVNTAKIDLVVKYLKRRQKLEYSSLSAEIHFPSSLPKLLEAEITLSPTGFSAGVITTKIPSSCFEAPEGLIAYTESIVLKCVWSWVMGLGNFILCLDPQLH